MKSILKTIFFTSLTLGCLGSLVGCGNKDSNEKVTVIDMDGTSITINKNPKKVE